jgi:hypothetical protein
MRKLLLAGAAVTAVFLPMAATAAPALASPQSAQATGICNNPDTGEFSSVTVSGVTYFLGAPNTITAGSAARLKPHQNASTLWIHCNNGDNTLELTQTQNGVIFALTTRDFSAGGDVTLEQAANFRSQRWVFIGTNPFEFLNIKTGLYLRVRNSGPIMFQTVTTGFTPTDWDQTAP